MPPDFRLIEVLRRHGVPFVVVGGHAVNYHGHARQTEDTDVVWLRSPESEAALLRALTEVKAEYFGDDIDPVTRIERTYPVSASWIRATHLMMVWTQFGFLDLFDFIPGFPLEDPKQFFEDSVEYNGLRYPSLSWLRRMKATSGRSKDITDLENLPE